ncbi:uncharacterized protein LOC125936363 [Panthera uncia]|uniref:uncharacterized protein LOC125936363 n=1 Tax=Panthera uncia TaxID=29064 RepID=UPI0020FF92D5|nr:uncharacterized protein LOC125936363 [Panthera uncia]
MEALVSVPLATALEPRFTRPESGGDDDRGLYQTREIGHLTLSSSLTGFIKGSNQSERVGAEQQKKRSESQRKQVAEIGQDLHRPSPQRRASNGSCRPGPHCALPPAGKTVGYACTREFHCHQEIFTEHLLPSRHHCRNHGRSRGQTWPPAHGASRMQTSRCFTVGLPAPKRLLNFHSSPLHLKAGNAGAGVLGSGHGANSHNLLPFYKKENLPQKQLLQIRFSVLLARKEPRAHLYIRDHLTFPEMKPFSPNRYLDKQRFCPEGIKSVALGRQQTVPGTISIIYRLMTRKVA